MGEIGGVDVGRFTGEEYGEYTLVLPSVFFPLLGELQGEISCRGDSQGGEYFSTLVLPSYEPEMLVFLAPIFCPIFDQFYGP